MTISLVSLRGLLPGTRMPTRGVGHPYDTATFTDRDAAEIHLKRLND